MDINPIDKAIDLLTILKEYTPTIKIKSDKGYEWLEEETDVCIEVLNPDSDNPDDGLTIICEDDGEFTLCFGSHVHYSPCDDEYSKMCQMALDILNNQVCSADLLCGEDKTWLCGGFVNRDEIERPARDVFDYLWSQEYFAEKIQSSGYEVHYSFWDKSLNTIIRAQKEEKMMDKDTYFADYEAYTENEIAEITDRGIILKNGGRIDFSECADTFKKEHLAEESKCVAERDITDFSFTFYTIPKPTMIKFIEKNAFIEFFSKRNTRQRFYELQKKIIDFGYKTYDES